MDKKIVLVRIIPLILFAIFLIPLVYVYSSLNYPVISNKMGFIWLIFCLILSIVNIVLAQFYKNKGTRIISLCLSEVFVFVCIAPLILFGSGNIYEVFPFNSKTENVEDYFALDKSIDQSRKQEITEYFPKEIPTNAEGTEYEYYYIPGACPALKVRLKFNTDEKTFKDLLSGVDGEWKNEQSNDYIAYYDSNAPGYYKHIIFETDNTVEYLYLSFMVSKDAEFDDSFNADGDYYVN